MKNYLLVLTTIGYLFICQFSHSQDGAIDPTFNPSDIGFGYGDGADNVIFAAAVQSDEKIVIVGGFTVYNGTSSNYIARLNQDGTIDPSFHVGTGTNGGVRDVAIQADGKIIIVGDFTSYNGISANRIARLLPSGEVDTSFDSGTGASSMIRELTILPNGKILIVGSFSTYNDISRNRIARVNSDGSLDASFDPGTGANGTIRTVVFQPNGTTLIGGEFSHYNNVQVNFFTCLNPDGTINQFFNSGTGVSGYVSSIALQSDGKVLIGGEFFSYNDVLSIRLARINSNGTIDSSFDVGEGPSNGVDKIAIQANGRILIGGNFFLFDETERLGLARLNGNGTLDTSFEPARGIASAFEIIILPDSKILIGGYLNAYGDVDRGYIIKIDAFANIDETFNFGTGANGVINSSYVYPDGRILIAGDFSLYNGQRKNSIAMLQPNGTIDASFGSNSGPTDGYFSTGIYKTFVLSDGKIYVFGDFANYNGVARNSVARLHPDGSLDSFFNPSTDLYELYYAMDVQPDGKVVLGGNFTTFNGVPTNRIARLNQNGAVDNTFNSGTGFTGWNASVGTIAIQTDGKIIVGGRFTNYNGTPKNNIVRLNSDGSLDVSFNFETTSEVNKIVLQPDNKIIVFLTGSTNIIRLNPDGTTDTTFENIYTNTGYFIDLAFQSDGKIVVGGKFQWANSLSNENLIRTDQNGIIDPSFDPGISTDDAIHSISFQQFDQLIIGGGFTSYNGTGRNRIARVLRGYLEVEDIKKTNLSVYPNPNNGVITITSEDVYDHMDVKIYSLTGELMYQNTGSFVSQMTVNFENQTGGIYLLTVNDKETFKIVKH